MPAQDAFYVLPDSLVAAILSRIPIKDAVKSSILSKRWRYLYTQMPKLSISPESILGSDVLKAHEGDISHMVSGSENIISDILLLHSRNLESFRLYSTWKTQHFHFSRQNVCKWVRYASICNVKYLTLDEHSISGELPPPALFLCSGLITLNLRGYLLTSFPINFVGFPLLTSCYLFDVQLTEESVVSLISLCPLLQKLDIVYGYAPEDDSGLGNVTIFSSTIEHLKMFRVKSLYLKCPKLKIFYGYKIEDLSVNGVRFYELSHAVSMLRIRCASTLTELSLSLDDRSELISANRFLHIVGNFQSLKELYIHMPNPFEREEERDVPLLNLIYRLPNLQSLSISGFFLQELARDPIADCIASPHVNLKKICIESYESCYEQEEIAVISCLLQSTPFLEKMEIRLPGIYNYFQLEEYKSQFMYCKKILHLRRASSIARIIIS